MRCESVLPVELRASIPSSNICRWRHESANKYEGFELNSIAKEKLTLLRTFAEHRQAQRVFRAYLRLVKTLIGIMAESKRYRAMLLGAKEQVIEVIDRVSAVLTVRKSIKVFGISRSTYQSWWQEVRVKCDASVLHRCRGRYPGQLTSPEVDTMRKLLADPKLAHWPVASIAHWAARQGQVVASLQTWYRYRKLFGLHRSTFAKPRPKPGLRANRPNQFWHADITIYKTEDGVRHYLYFVVDNYSRKILSWRISGRVSAVDRVATLRAAWAKVVLSGGQELSIDLITDGGPENVNRTVDAFLREEAVRIRRKVALEDISFSNSMVEATNKLIKYHYLFPARLKDGQELRKRLPDFIHDFNAVRPHHQLKGLTPAEAYAGHKVESIDLAKKYQKARVTRAMANRSSLCKVCIG